MILISRTNDNTDNTDTAYEESELILEYNLTKEGINGGGKMCGIYLVLLKS